MSNVYSMPSYRAAARTPGQHLGYTTVRNVMQYRHSAAQIARTVRAMWPNLQDDTWTRRDWNQQARAAAYNHIARMLRKEKDLLIGVRRG